jgi:CDGSH-type Zn-finger protein/uncharacterized Fe-S cluster protein YjdI
LTLDTTNSTTASSLGNSREQLVHALYEAAELEHNLMCTYLYAAFSLRSGEGEGLSAAEASAVERWRASIMDVAIGEMGHLAAVWNITVALGAAPRIGRMNFPLDPGYLPAGIIVKLAPFNPYTLQHFIYLERPHGSTEAEGEGFVAERAFVRGNPIAHLTPMGMDYDTVGTFYESLKGGLVALVDRVGEDVAFRGNPALQLAGAEYGFAEAKPVKCLKTALAAFDSIVAQGEGSPAYVENSHFQKFLAIRSEYAALRAANPRFAPAFPAATNPVLRRPPRPEGRVWIEGTEAVSTVDLASAGYGLMLRLLAYAYAVPAGQNAKAAVMDLGIGLMRTILLLGEHAARLPAGPAHPECHAGVSFTALRDSASLPPGPAAEGFFVERLQEFSVASAALAARGAPRLERAAERFAALAKRSLASFAPAPATTTAPAHSGEGGAGAAAAPRETPLKSDSTEVVAGRNIEIQFQARRCIHSRFCVTGAPKVFLANVQGPWIHPDAMPVERLVEVAHACPSGAIEYTRSDGQPNETAPPVNLAAVREAGPYAFRGELQISGTSVGFRRTLCRCGASRNKPYCDGSHHDIGFSASGEPPTGATDMPAVRDGLLAIEPEPNGPLQVRGNLEITSGTGRVVARVQAARLCRCGGSRNKPFCDGTHAKIGFRS